MGNIGDLFVKGMRQATKGYLYQLLEVSDYYVKYRQTAKSVLWNVSIGHQWVTDPFRWFCELMWKVCG